MKKIILPLLLLVFFSFPEKALALVCTSPKKGAALLYESSFALSNFGVSNHYRYSQISTSNKTTPMLKYPHIYFLRQNQNPDVCPSSCTLPQTGESWTSENMCCPAKKIKQVADARRNLPNEEKYWLILNEPEWEEEKYYQNNAGRMADDIAFAISFIKRYDSQAKFMVAWFPGIREQWSSKAGQYGLNTNYAQVFAGWHIHTYHWQSSLWGKSNIDNNYFEAFRRELLNHPAKSDKQRFGFKLWLTEFGTLMYDGSPNCNDLGVKTGCECRFDRVGLTESDIGRSGVDPNQLCVYFMEKLLYWLESNESPIDRYFWWTYGNCDPAWLQGAIAGNRDACFGALATKTSGGTRLNNLGMAFAAIPNTNGICWYGANPTATPTRRPTNTPSPIPTNTSTPIPTNTPVPCLDEEKGNLDCDSQGLIDELDLAKLLSSWTQGSLAKLTTLLSNWQVE